MFALLPTALALLLIAALALACVGVLLTPVYFWLLWRDAQSPAADMAASRLD